VVPWLRETGIADHVHGLSKDEIRTAIAVPLLGEDDTPRVIIDAMESLLRDAHRLCFDGPDCMLTYQCRVVLSSITKDIDSSNDSTRLSAPLRLKHALNASISPPPRLLYVLCARIS
jgi:hypothetical protein